MTSSDAMTASSQPKTPPLDWVRQSGKVDLVLQDIETKLGKRRRQRKRAGAAALCVLAFASLAFWAVPYVRETDTIATQPAQRQTLALADGSTAELNAQTDLHTDFRYGRRIVRLDRGEAFFSVTKDPNHPFLVETPAGTVQVTGTQFNVRVTGSQLEVTLLEGGVKVDQLANLGPGQQFDSVRGGVNTLTPAELDRATAWRQGRLVLDGLTLAEAAARIASYHGKEIKIAPEVASLRMGGSCPLDDLPGFFEFLPQALSVSVLSPGDGSYRVIAR